ncbi:hypothetical protein O988_02136 [Pseudogymnoascus sp. VKM F-3808]|nr:hypothetical protein O988_02136 [Pseudogymnoascus sp. VKM F-3808]
MGPSRIVYPGCQRVVPLRHHRPHSSCHNESTIYDPTCTGNVTVIDTTTIISSMIVPVTHYVNVTHYLDVVVSTTETSTVLTSITESTTTTLHYTVSTTQTNPTTDTDTQTTTATVPATITTYTTQTVISTTDDPCPSTCSISVGTVNLYFWPTSRPYTYPSTYIDTALAYTFTSPSVYMLIPTAIGTNSLGPAGPSTSNWILPLDLEEVSTIIDGTVTRQLTLSDLGTDCPQTAEPTAIASMVDSRCDPILAAPKQVVSWAYPCNACGRFGLFDPPYAVPTITGPLVETTTPVPVKTTATPTPTAPPVGVLLIIHFINGDPVSTDTILTTGVSGTVTSSVGIWSTSSSTSNTISEIVSGPDTETATSPQATATPTSVFTGSATRMAAGYAWLIPSVFIALFLI